MRLPFVAWSIVAASLVAGSLMARQDRQTGDLRKKLKDEAENFWIYDDLGSGYAQSRDTGKPLLVSIR